MFHSENQSNRISDFRSYATILICFSLGGFCLFKGGAVGLFNAPAQATTVASLEIQPKYKMKSVADFKVGDNILAFNHETGKHEQSKVVQTFKRTSQVGYAVRTMIALAGC